MIDRVKLACYGPAVPLFGENLKRLRQEHGLTQEALAERLGFRRPGPVALQETKHKARVPLPRTIRRYAAALGIAPAELMKGVVTEYDRLREEKSVPNARTKPRPRPHRAAQS